MNVYSTRQRKTLLAYLAAHADESLSARHIADALVKDGISISAVYRNLAALEQDGKVRRLSKEGSRQIYYRYTDADGCKRHLHLACFQCGKTYHMDVPASDGLIQTVAQSTHFAVDSARTVLYGICDNCQHRPLQQKEKSHDHHDHD